DRHRLARERGFIHVQLGGGEQAAVGRHRLARLEDDDIARHELARIDLHGPSVPHHRGARHLELEQRLHRLACAQLGEEAEGGVDDEHGADGGGVQRVAQEERDGGRSEEQEDDDALELVDQDAPGGNRLGRVERVGPIAFEAAARLIVGEAIRRGGEARECVVGREGVPGSLYVARRRLHGCTQTMDAPLTTWETRAPMRYATPAATAPTASISRPLRNQQRSVTKLRSAPTGNRVSSGSTVAVANGLGPASGRTMKASRGTAPATMNAQKVASPCRPACGSWTARPAAARAASSERIERKLLAPMENPSATRLAK